MSYADQLTALGIAADTEIAALETQVAQLEAELEATKPPPGEQYRKWLGINGHSTFNNDPTYGDDARVLQTMDHLGASKVRDILVLNQDQTAYFNACADLGMKLCLTIGTYDKFADSQKAGYVTKLRQYAPLIEAVAGFNEPDNGRLRSAWLPRVVAQQKWLYTAIKNDPALAHIKVLPGAIMNVNPNLAADLAALYAAIDGYYDHPNAHIYPGNTPDPAKYIAGRFAMFPAPPWVTEGGATTYTQTEAIQSRNCTALLKACGDAGVPLFVYEALDNAPPGASTEPEHYFGVYDYAYQPKPAATALRAMCGVT